MPASCDEIGAGYANLVLIAEKLHQEMLELKETCEDIWEKAKEKQNA